MDLKSIKKRNRRFTISLIISMLVLVILTPIMFNFREIFSIGIYNVENDFSNSYSDGTAGVNVQLYLEYIDNDRYIIETLVEPISTGDVDNNGLLSNNAEYLRDGSHVLTRSVQYGTPRSYSFYRFTSLLYKYNNITCYGTIEINIETGGMPVNDTISFRLTFFIPYNSEDYTNIDLIVYSMFITHFFLYIIIPLVLVWLFKPIFGLDYSKEDEERDKKFQNHLRNQLNKVIKESKE